jgi:hypothetical protein
VLQDYLDSNEIPWHNNLTEILARIQSKLFSSVRLDMSTINGNPLVYNNNRFIPFQKINFLHFENTTDVLLVKSNVNLMGFILTNDQYKQRLEALGLAMVTHDSSYSKLFSEIYKSLFKMTPRIQRQFDNFMQKAKQNAKTTLICAQVRLGGDSLTFKDPIRIERERVGEIWEFIKSNFSDAINSNNYKLFVTSDHENIFEEAKKEFGSDMVLITNGTITHIDKDQSESHCKRHDKAFLDFNLLGMCDKAVVSRSTFGYGGVRTNYKGYKELYIFLKSENGIYKFVRI